MKRAIQGTLEYMAPEVLQKKPSSPASDVYALAIAINELATGEAAHMGALVQHNGWFGSKPRHQRPFLWGLLPADIVMEVLWGCILPVRCWLFATWLAGAAQH
jgi:serine/threonine protein kinase